MACGDPAETPNAGLPEPADDDEGPDADKGGKGSAPSADPAAGAAAESAAVARRVRLGGLGLCTLRACERHHRRCHP